AEKVLKVTFLEAKMLKNEEICPEHLVLSILKHNDNPASRILRDFEIDYEVFKAELEFVKQDQDFTSIEPFAQASSSDSEDSYDDDEPGKGFQQRKTNTKSRTPVLDNFGRDVTKLAEEGKLD
ncbi:MAG: Clp protease N-terminal domain-containing protein, partial [Saprospiraceae bacterium]|nr:Clp protease N-terminal domain-containing protein [Saprospiraceae bacterium]